MAKTFLSLSNLTKKYGKQTLLQDINLDIPLNSMNGIFGPSGCGKTTLLQIIGCLDMPTNGTIYINETPVSQKELLDHRRKTFGFVFQSFQLLSSETVLNNVILPAIIDKKIWTNSQRFEKRAKELLDQVGLSSKYHQNVNTLSGGEKQRVAIARSLMNDPNCILADEPTGNLDEETKQSIFHLLMNVVKNHGKTLIMVTHDSSFTSSFDNTYTIKQKNLQRI